MARIATAYLSNPATVITLNPSRVRMVPAVLTQGTAVTARHGGTTISGTVTTAGASPVLTFGQPVGPGKVRFDTGSGPTMAGITQDATSGKYYPATQAEWLTTMAVAGVSRGAPSRIWLMQESALPLIDSVGGDNIVAGGGAGGAISYANTRSGHTRKFVNFSAASGLYLVSSNAAPGSARLFGLLAVDSISANGSTLLYFNGELAYLATPAPATEARFGNPGTGSFTAGTANPIGAPKPFAFGTDATALVSRYSDNAEKITATYGISDGSVLPKKVYLGAAVNNTPAFGLGYLCMFTGADAEWTAAEEKAIEQTLGWTIPWS